MAVRASGLGKAASLAQSHRVLRVARNPGATRSTRCLFRTLKLSAVFCCARVWARALSAFCWREICWSLTSLPIGRVEDDLFGSREVLQRRSLYLPVRVAMILIFGPGLLSWMPDPETPTKDEPSRFMFRRLLCSRHTRRSWSAFSLAPLRNPYSLLTQNFRAQTSNKR